jgi:tmRNA-binding protein
MLERQNEIRQLRVDLPTSFASHAAQTIYLFISVIPDYSTLPRVTHHHAASTVRAWKLFFSLYAEYFFAFVEFNCVF